MFQCSRMVGSALVIFVVVVPALQAQSDKVFRALSPDATEKLLRSFKIEFNKSSSPKGDEHYYEFTRNGFRIRLTHFSPQELMLDCVFPNLPLARVNQWNTMTKLSRASAKKEGKTEVSLLEYGLELTGGATEGTIKQFIERFDDELKQYRQFVTSQFDDSILPAVTNEKLESILKSLAIEYQKKISPNGGAMFDFVLHDHRLRLYNFNGEDLMMDANFRKISLEDANRYNLSRKFIRVVNYKGKDTEFTALEINFDCKAGVTAGMIRHWIVNFGEDVRHFADYAKKVQTAEKK